MGSKVIGEVASVGVVFKMGADMLPWVNFDILEGDVGLGGFPGEVDRIATAGTVQGR